jgi:hypothetical protein
MIIFAGTPSDAQALTSILVSAGAWWLLVAAITFANRGQLSRQPVPTRAAADRALDRRPEAAEDAE